ncbi:coagulation factor X-like [Poecilia latipinna]|uniref:coagulation factor X-like n=1 Tax=Poecilia latipinna TaxID=48699 RepID=UPI00072D92C9|nr:PREDICTED: coagulation factor X-like [Poecilia latipinna]
MSAFLLTICLLGGSFLQVFSQDKELCDNENGGCEHFCHVAGGSVVCACADGYFLAQDNQSCNSNETFRCGAIITDVQGQNRTEKRSFTEEQHGRQRNSSSQISSDREAQTGTINGEDCPPGQCPWQALLINQDNIGFCGGTILSEYIILTAAQCVAQTRYLTVKLGVFNTSHSGGNEALHVADAIVTHHGYSPQTYFNDVALVKLAKPIRFTRYILPACMPEPDFMEKVLMRQPDALVSGFGYLGEGQPSTVLQRLSVPYVDWQTCMDSTPLSISLRMFCAGYDSMGEDSFQGDSGGPHVTRYRGTFFITGIRSWGKGHARKGKYGVYTQVSKFIRWIKEGVKKLTPIEKRGSRTKRHHGAVKRFRL